MASSKSGCVRLAMAMFRSSQPLSIGSIRAAGRFMVARILLRRSISDMYTTVQRDGLKACVDLSNLSQNNGRGYLAARFSCGKFVQAGLSGGDFEVLDLFVANILKILHKGAE